MTDDPSNDFFTMSKVTHFQYSFPLKRGFFLNYIYIFILSLNSIVLVTRLTVRLSGGRLRDRRIVAATVATPLRYQHDINSGSHSLESRIPALFLPLQLE